MTASPEAAPAEVRESSPGWASRLPSGLRHLDTFGVLSTLICAVVVLAIGYSLYSLVTEFVLDQPGHTVSDVLESSWFRGMLVDTFFVVTVSGVLAIVVASLFAWINERTNAGIGSFGDVLPLVPLFIPTVAVAVGWTLLGNSNVGFLNMVLEPILDLVGLTWTFDVESRVGIILVYTLFLVPYAYLPIVAGFRNVDTTLDEAARVSGASPAKILFGVSIRSIAPSFASAFLLVSIIGLSLYSVPLILANEAGLDILAVRIIRSARNEYPPRYDVSVFLSLVLIAILVLIWIAQRRLVGSGRTAQLSGAGSRASKVDLGRWKWAARVAIGGYVALAAVLPLLALIVVSFQTFWTSDFFKAQWTWANYSKILDTPSGVNALTNSSILAFGGGALIVATAAILMISLQRRMGVSARAIEAVAKAPAGIPNTVLGVAIILAFAGPPFGLGATLWILLLGYFTVYLPYAAITIEGGIEQLNASLVDAASLCGATRARAFRQITLPLLRPGIMAAWALVAVRIVGDLALAVMLASGRTPVVGFVLLDVWEFGTYGQLAALSLLMTVLTVPAVAIMLRLGQPRWRRATRRRRSARSPVGAAPSDLEPVALTS